MSPEELVKRFDISLPAAKIRAGELARIERAKTGRPRPLPPGILDFLKQQKSKGFAVVKVKLDDEE